ncbi:uncharacterized protein CBL_00432 [Carabus blaptoides fortunei]
MCSLGGEVMMEEHAGSSVKNNLKLDTCKKCFTEKPSIILRKIDAYCKSCFLPATIHKFRATIGKYRLIKPNERVLIIYVNGHPSSALLHFIRGGLDLPTHKKLRLEPVILYIDDHKLSPEERLAIAKNVTHEISSYNFPGYVTSLHNFINDFNAEPKYYELNNNLIVENLLSNANSKSRNRTQYDDVMEVSRRQLIIQMAKQLSCRVVFTPEISVDVAVKMLSNLSLGRGSHLSLDVGVYDDRDSEVKILQPLRYFDMKELAYYNIFNGIEPVNAGFTKDKQSATSSVNKLITKFVTDLQENYPSTVKTVVRTGDKLMCETTGNICDICKAPVENQEQLSSSEAKDFSHWVSTHIKDLNTRSDYDNKNVCNSKLCYGCRYISNVLNI